MKKHVLASTMVAPMTALTAYDSVPGMGVTRVSATEAAKIEAAKAGEARSGDNKAEIPASATNDKAYTLKISTSQTDQFLIIQAYMKLADRVKEDSNGCLEIEAFPSSQLGNDEDVIEQTIQGTGIAVNTDAARMGTYAKDMGILMMGYFADNYEECRKITETDTSKGRENELADKYGIRVSTLDFYDGPRYFMTNKGVKTSEDLEGLRVRTIGAEVCTESIEVMGGTSTAMARGEVYNGIQSKALDVCEVQNTFTYPSRTYEVCKYQAKTGHFQFLQVLVYDGSWSRSLPEDLQKILVDTAREVGAESIADVLTEAESCEKKMVGAELAIVEPGAEAFKTAVKPAYERLGYMEPREQLCKEIGKTN